MGNPRFLCTRSPNGRGLAPIGTGQHQICLVRPFLSRKAIFFWVLWAPYPRIVALMPDGSTVRKICDAHGANLASIEPVPGACGLLRSGELSRRAVQHERQEGVPDP